jgi:putative ABC transport system permease protein
MNRPPFRRLFQLFSTRVDPADVDAEFESHLAMRTRDLEKEGLTPERARAQALDEFGDVHEARRVCQAEDERRMQHYRWTLWLEDLRQDLGFAARSLRRQRAFAISTLVTLSIAVALAAIAYGIVHAYLVRPLPYPDADRLVRVFPRAAGDRFPDPRVFEQVDWRVADEVFAATASWNPDVFTIAGQDRTELARGAWVSPEYFSLLGLKPALGRPFEPGEHVESGPAVIISDALWARLYARDPSILGRAIRVESLEVPGRAVLVTVVGIMPAGAWHVDRFTDLLRPLPLGSRYPMMAELESGMPMAEAERRLNAVVLPQMAGIDSSFHYAVVGTQQDYVERVRPTLVALMGGALFLLLIAGANVAGAQTARSAARRAEMQVRTALGASRGRIMFQLLVENLALAATSGMIGAILAAVTLGSVGASVGEQLGTGVPGGSERLALQPGVLMLLVAIGSLVGAAFGLFPALILTRTSGTGGSLLGTAKGAARSTASPVLRRTLIVAQVGFTVMLLVGAGLMGRTIMTIALTPLGFNDLGVLKGDVFLPPNNYNGADAIRAGAQRLIAGAATTPGIRAVATAFPDPLHTFMLSPVHAMGDVGGASAAREAAPYVVSAGYFELLEIPLREGRTFDGRDAPGSTPAAIVSEGLARALWPGESAVGRRMRTQQDSVWRTVIGVVGETRQPAEPHAIGELYLPFEQHPQPILFLLASTGDDPTVAGLELQRAVSRVDPGLALANVTPLGDLADRATQRHRALATVLALFAGLALGLAMLGLYASLAYLVAQRRREIAIRVAVGADLWAVRGLVAREGGMLVTAGLLVGIALSLSLTRLLASQLYGVTPTDPGTFAAIVVLLGGAGVLAAVAPVRAATRVPPVEVLRSD